MHRGRTTFFSTEQLAIENIAEKEQAVRGIIIANSISNDLVLATSRLSDVQLFEYELSVSLKKVKG